MAKKFVSKITDMDVDFGKWYQDLCVEAKLMSYSDTQGFIIYRPYGYAIWEKIKEFLNANFKATGHSNVYMPMLIPESLFQKEKDHIVGFAPETATVTTAGSKTLEENLIVRPTSEVLFTSHFASVVESYKDLPLKYNQWCSVVRWEKTTKPFLRGREFLWQEGHTVHETAKEAKQETQKMLKVYEKLGKDLLAIPFVSGKKTEKEKFAGAEATYTIEALMHDGKALQSGTSHYFGDGFTKAFGVNFQDKNNKLCAPFQTSWGVTTRLIGAVIMVHGDNDGLVLPPYLAPTQVVAVPVLPDKLDKTQVNLVIKEIKRSKLSYEVDESDKSHGFKFAESEMKGIPFRVEFGPNDLKENSVIVFKRNTRTKTKVLISKLSSFLKSEIKVMHNEMYERALEHLNSNIRHAKNYAEFKTLIERGGYVSIDINKSAEEIIKTDTTATARVISKEKPELTICPVTGKKVNYRVLFAKAY